MKKKLVYLACPYTHSDPDMRLHRFNQANIAAGVLIAAGNFIFSPISHTHPICEASGLQLGWETWKEFDRAFIECCAKMVVLCLDGWKESKGVQAEIVLAQQLGIPINYLVVGEDNTWIVEDVTK